MALYKCFSSDSTESLPDPNSSLAKKVPMLAIALANVEVKKVIDGKNHGCGSYTKLSAKVKAELGEYATENGMAATLRKYLKKYPNHKRK